MLVSVAFEANLKDMSIIIIPRYRPFVIITIKLDRLRRCIPHLSVLQISANSVILNLITILTMLDTKVHKDKKYPRLLFDFNSCQNMPEHAISAIVYVFFRI